MLAVLTTMPDEAHAEALAEQLIERGLAGCVNVMPRMKSVYRWKGKVEKGEEHLLLIKARDEHYPALEAEIKANHPYELPEIICFKIAGGLKEYLEWLGSGTAL